MGSIYEAMGFEPFGHAYRRANPAFAAKVKESGMSGLFKGIGKIFKKVVKVAKKIALPALAIAAVVVTGRRGARPASGIAGLGGLAASLGASPS
jgi:hypothetical protein